MFVVEPPVFAAQLTKLLELLVKPDFWVVFQCFPSSFCYLLPWGGYYDYLEIAGTRVSGTDVELPKIVEVPAGEQTITWLSDHSEGEGADRHGGFTGIYWDLLTGK